MLDNNERFKSVLKLVNHLLYIHVLRYYISLSLKIEFVLANSADPDETPPLYAAFHLGMHCLPYTCTRISTSLGNCGLK